MRLTRTTTVALTLLLFGCSTAFGSLGPMAQAQATHRRAAKHGRQGASCRRSSGQSSQRSRHGQAGTARTGKMRAKHSLGRLHRHRGASHRCNSMRSARVKPFPLAMTAAVGTLLGDEAVEPSAGYAPAGQAEAFTFVAGTSGEAGTVYVYVDAHDKAHEVAVGLYSSASGRPSALLSSGSLGHPHAGAWNAVPIATDAVSAGTTYWVAVLGGGGTLRYRDRSSGPCTSVASAQTTLVALPASWSLGALSSACPISAYVAGTTLLSAPTESTTTGTTGTTTTTEPTTTSTTETTMTTTETTPTTTETTTTTTTPPPTSAAPVNETPPSVSGTAAAGDTLNASTGTWANGPTGYAYQWEDCNQSGQACIPIVGATASSYTLKSSDVGDAMTVVVTASSAGGSASAAAADTSTVVTSAYRTFYVDYASGSESNTGTSESSPWKRAPGMQGFTAPYTHAVGDHFIFRGGVTWPNVTLPLIAEGSGEAGKDDYYGANHTWYTGASFNKPTFDAEGKRTYGTDPVYKTSVDDMMWMFMLDYITVEDIAFANWTAEGLPAGTECTGIEAGNGGHPGYDTHITLNLISFTGWSIDYLSNKNNNCGAIGERGEPNDSSITNSVIRGRAGHALGWSVYCMSRVEHDIISDATNLVTPCPNIDSHTAVVAKNVLYDCGYPYWPPTPEATHGDAIMDAQNPPIGSVEYVYDNVIYNTGDGSATVEGKEGVGGECESYLGPGEEKAQTTYVWNNVLYNLYGDEPAVDYGDKDFYFWNNTVTGGFNLTNPCLRSGHATTIDEIRYENNLCITSATTSMTEGVETGGSDPVKADFLTIDHNLVLTPEQASADGYTTSEQFIYSPTSGSAPTVGTGTNLALKCTEAMTLCVDTTYGGTRTPAPRSSTGAWDIGAYQW